MDGFLNGGLIGGLIGGAIAGLIVLIIGLLQGEKKCPECDQPLPKQRKPKNRRQFLWGGWTCEHCGCEIDAKGRKINDA